jgi:hypothetical protein
MIPPVVASSAISVIGQLGSAVLGHLKHATAAGRTADGKGASEASHSFGALLSAHGVSSDGTSVGSGTGVTGA